MNSPHMLLYSVISLMLFSSIVSLVFVSIQNHLAVKKYHSLLRAGEVPQDNPDYSFDPTDFKEINFFETPSPATPVLAEEEIENRS